MLSIAESKGCIKLRSRPFARDRKTVEDDLEIQLGRHYRLIATSWHRFSWMLLPLSMLQLAQAALAESSSRSDLQPDPHVDDGFRAFRGREPTACLPAWSV